MTKQLIKISQLSKETGVSIPTIKFYLREGLLPPSYKTSKNMAFYGPEHVKALQLIQELSQKRYLPLRVIKNILETQDLDHLARMDLSELEMEIVRFLDSESKTESIIKEDVINEGVINEEELAVLERMGLLSVNMMDGKPCYQGNDAVLVRNIYDIRHGGFISALGFTVDDLAMYKDLVEILARQEIRLLFHRITGKLDVPTQTKLAKRGIDIFGQFMVTLRRKIILNLVEEIAQKVHDERESGSPD